LAFHSNGNTTHTLVADVRTSSTVASGSLVDVMTSGAVTGLAAAQEDRDRGF
jgi:hypothetical protein